MNKFFILLLFTLISLLFLNRANASSNYICLGNGVGIKLQQIDSNQQTELSVMGFAIINGTRIHFSTIVGKSYSPRSGNLIVNYKTSSTSPKPEYLHIELDESTKVSQVQYKVWYPGETAPFLSPAYQFKTQLNCNKI